MVKYGGVLLDDRSRFGADGLALSYVFSLHSLATATRKIGPTFVIFLPDIERHGQFSARLNAVLSAPSQHFEW